MKTISLIVQYVGSRLYAINQWETFPNDLIQLCVNEKEEISTTSIFCLSQCIISHAFSVEPFNDTILDLIQAIFSNLLISIL